MPGADEGGSCDTLLKVAYKTIIFDLGRVIVPFEFDRGFKAMSAISRCTPEEVQSRIASTELMVPFETGEVAPHEFARRICDALGVDIEYDRFCGIWSSIFLPHTLIPESMVEGLKKRYRLLLLSNTNAIHFEMIRENYGLLRHFDHFIVSHEVGALKPSPKIYQAALQKAECLPGECFFTDDVPAFVEGAREAGIEAVQFHSATQLEEEMRSRGIDWE